MRCDLHVHSIASGMCGTPVLSRICRESYNQPEEVYTRLKQLGMSIVTLTDHDSIDAAEALRKYADFFLSEEATVQMPSGTEMHLGVYGITERDHIEIQRRRKDFISLMMYLTERKLFFSVNHVFSGLTGRRSTKTSAGLRPTCRRLNRGTARCGPRRTERCTAGIASRKDRHRRERFAHDRGSRAHVHGSSWRANRRRVLCRTASRTGAGPRCARQLRQVDCGRVQHRVVFVDGKTVDSGTYAAGALVPVFTAGHWLNEIRFARNGSAALERGEKRQRMFWDMDSSFEANWG